MKLKRYNHLKLQNLTGKQTCTEKFLCRTHDKLLGKTLNFCLYNADCPENKQVLQIPNTASGIKLLALHTKHKTDKQSDKHNQVNTTEEVT